MMKAVIAHSVGLALLLAGCSRTSPEELFSKGQDAHKLKDYPIAIAQYTLLIENHPDRPEAETSQFLLATVYNDGTHEYQKAVDAFKTYTHRYPDGKEGPTALFMVGYLYNNELRNLDSAAAAYQRFLEKYPDHEMATSAQFELANLGKSADELLPKPVMTDETAEKPASKGKKKK